MQPTLQFLSQYVINEPMPLHHSHVPEPLGNDPHVEMRLSAARPAADPGVAGVEVGDVLHLQVRGRQAPLEPLPYPLLPRPGGGGGAGGGGELERLLLHGPEHVEEAVVAGGGEALGEAEEGDEVGGDGGDGGGGLAGESVDEEGGEALGELGVGVGVEADAGGVGGVRVGADPDLGDAAADAVGVGPELGGERGQAAAVVEELPVLELAVGDGLEEVDHGLELRGEGGPALGPCGGSSDGRRRSGAREDALEGD